MLADLGSREDGARLAHEELEEGELLVRQRDFLSASFDDALGQVQLHIADTQDRRLTLSMRIGEAAAAPQKQAPRETKMPKKATEESKGNTIGELIKQKLGNLTIDKKDD